MDEKKPLIDDRPLDVETLYRDAGELLKAGKEDEALELVEAWNDEVSS